MSQRYNNSMIDFNQMKEYKNNLVFIGSESEYNTFSNKWFKMPFAGKFNNLLQIVEIIAGAKGYIANPTGLFAVAELLKVPRMLISSDFIQVNKKTMLGPKNVYPLGGLWTISTNGSNFKNNLQLMINCFVILY